MDKAYLKPIETQYKGYRFRSRLEARWAVFFDAIGWSWEYEAEGFDLDGLYYLPDFWLPDDKTFVEVKPGGLSEDDLEKVNRLSVYYLVILAIGLPEEKSYVRLAHRETDAVYFVRHNGNEVGNFELASQPDEYNWLGVNAWAIEQARSARFEHRR